MIWLFGGEFLLIPILSLASFDILHYFESAAIYLGAIDLYMLLLINIGMSNAFFDMIMPYLTHLGDYWAGWIFVLGQAALNAEPVGRGMKSGLLVSLIYGCVSAFQLIVKHLADRPRPFIDHEIIVKIAVPDDPSLPSGHAATAFMMAVILSNQFPKYRYLFYALACLVGFSRVYLGIHYPSDVIAGTLIGYGITKLLIRKINRKTYARRLTI